MPVMPYLTRNVGMNVKTCPPYNYKLRPYYKLCHLEDVHTCLKYEKEKQSETSI